MVRIIISILLIVQLEGNPFFFGQQTSGITTASDNFDSYANGALLESQLNWAAQGSSSIIVVKPASDGSVRGNVLTANNVVRRTSPVFSANHEAEVSFVLGSGGGACGVAVRVSIRSIYMLRSSLG